MIVLSLKSVPFTFHTIIKIQFSNFGEVTADRYRHALQPEMVSKSLSEIIVDEHESTVL